MEHPAAHPGEQSATIGAEGQGSDDVGTGPTFASISEFLPDRESPPLSGASRIGEVVSVQVIPRPHEDLGGILPFAKKSAAAASPKNDGA